MITTLLNKIKYNKYDIVFLDINSLTIVPNLNKEIYLSADRINITPFIETIKLYFYIIKYFGYTNTTFVIVYDTGISSKILKIYPKYKKNRHSRRISKNINTFNRNTYDYNIGLLNVFFELMNEIPINELNKIEADFVIGYLENRIKHKRKLTLTHDMDLFMLFNEMSDVIYKQIIPNKQVKYLFIDNIEKICDIIDFQYIKDVTELLYYRALIGDKSDNISSPFGINRKTIVNNFFYNMYMDNIKITYDLILNYFKVKFKTDNIFNKFKTDLDRNLFIMNIFNDQIFTHDEKIYLNLMVDKIDKIDSNIKQFNLNEIIEFFDKYGLFYTKEELINIFKSIGLIN